MTNQVNGIGRESSEELARTTPGLTALAVAMRRDSSDEARQQAIRDYASVRGIEESAARGYIATLRISIR